MAPGQLYRFAWGLYLGMALAGGLWIGLRQGVIPLSLFIDVHSWWVDLGLGLGAGLVLLGIWRGAEKLLPRARELEEQLGLLLGSITGTEAVVLALLSGFAEELFFRGALQGAWGWLAASVVFALLHSGPGSAFRLWTAFAAVAGALLGGLMVWRGNLLGPVVGHCLVNAVNLRRLSSRVGESGRLPGERGQSEREI